MESRQTLLRHQKAWGATYFLASSPGDRDMWERPRARLQAHTGWHRRTHTHTLTQNKVKNGRNAQFLTVELQKTHTRSHLTFRSVHAVSLTHTHTHTHKPALLRSPPAHRFSHACSHLWLTPRHSTESHTHRYTEGGGRLQPKPHSHSWGQETFRALEVLQAWKGET